MVSHGPPPLDGVLETVLYYSAPEEDEVERFYGGTLGLRSIGRSRGRFLFFRSGVGVFLLFEFRKAREQGSPPPHGAEGPGHACFRAAPDRYEGWKAHLEGQGVEIEEEIRWPGGGRSFYFRDPAGNALEIAEGDVWPP